MAYCHPILYKEVNMAVSRQPVKKEVEVDKDKDVLALIKSTAKELNSKYGEGSAMIRTEDCEDDMLDIPFWIKTGIPQLDFAVGGKSHPGIPGGRITEIYGPESNGKTSVALFIMKKAIEDGAIGLYQDSENALTDERIEQFGLNPNRVIFTQPETMEDVFEQQETTIGIIRKTQKDSPMIIVWDSVAATPTKSEVEGDYGDSVMGIHARIMSQALRKIKGLMKNEQVAAIYINQIRDKIGVVFG